jgi:hypothetical protein
VPLHRHRVDDGVIIEQIRAVEAVGDGSVICASEVIDVAEPGGIGDGEKIGDLYSGKVWLADSVHVTMNYGEIGRRDSRAGGSVDGGVGVYIGGAPVMRALGAARSWCSR